MTAENRENEKHAEEEKVEEDMLNDDEVEVQDDAEKEAELTMTKWKCKMMQKKRQKVA